MNKRTFSILRKTTKRGIVLFVICVLSFATIANGQKARCKKWTYDFSEAVKYFDTPLEACKSFVKEKYPNDNYKASIEAVANDAETYRCSADDTYFGLVYKKECDSCCNKPSHEQQSQLPFRRRQFKNKSLYLSLCKMTNGNESLIPNSEHAYLLKTIFENYAPE